MTERDATGGMPELAGQLSYNPDRFQNRVIFELDNRKAILFAFAKGQQLKEHKTSHDVLLIMLEGDCSFSIAGTEQHLGPGQVYSIPANVPHALEAVTDFKMVLIK